MVARPRVNAQDLSAGIRESLTPIGVQYKPKVALKVLEAVAHGGKITHITREPGYPSYNTWMKWLAAEPALREAYEEARAMSALAFEEKALEQAEKLVGEHDYTGTRVRAIEVAMGQWRWSASKRDRKTYGENNAASAIVPVQINTTLDLGNGQTPHMPQTQQVVNPYTVEVELPKSEAPDPEPAPKTPEDQSARLAALVPERLSGKLAQPRSKGGRPKGKGKHKSPSRTKATASRYAHTAAKRAAEKGKTTDA